MPFLNILLRRGLPAAALFSTLASAESCWYPDGKTLSSDIPCVGGQEFSACCSSQSFCLSGGLCLTGGIVTRGSCTDKTWGSEECSGFCKSVSIDGEVAITPCSTGLNSNTFVCGLDNGQCKDSSKTFALSTDTKLVLRPAQIQSLAGNAIASGIAGSTTTVTSAATSGDGLYHAGALIGTAFGVGLPLLIALGVVLYLLIREKRKPMTRSSMYYIPDDDNKGSIMIRPAPSMIKRGTTRSSQFSKSSSKFGSERGSMRTERTARTASPKPLYIPTGAEVQKPPSLHSPVQSVAGSQRASYIPSFAERIETTRVIPHLVDVRDSNMSSRHELDSMPSSPQQAQHQTPQRIGSIASEPSSPQEIQRFELPAQRMSK